jgi:hypothetical protein
MPLRTFEDSKGETCKVWNVTPFVVQGTERRMTERRMAAGTLYSGPERESGWLCFERGNEKRRLTPVPAGWDDAPDHELESLFDSARPVTRRALALP